MKKVLFLTLFLMILGAASTYAQVTIGDDSKPHPGAVLDLKSSKGLLLPKVTLANVAIFQLSEEKEDEAAGMMVYNTYDATIGGQGQGLYIWDGAKWLFAGISGPVQTPVTLITVTTAGGATSIMSGSPLQFSADIQPANATNRNIIWSVVPGTGTASIDPVTGLMQANVAGTVTVRATATDGSNVFGQKEITITPASVPVTDIILTPSTAQTITAGGTLQLSAQIVPSNASDQGVQWSITAPVGTTGATVSATGLFSATAATIYTVRATSSGNTTIYKELTITVNPQTFPNSCAGCEAAAKSRSYSTKFTTYWYFPTWSQCWVGTTGVTDGTLKGKWIFNGSTFVWDGESHTGLTNAYTCTGPI